MDYSEKAIIRIERQKIFNLWEVDKNARHVAHDVWLADPYYDKDSLPACIQNVQYGDTFLRSPYNDNLFYRVEEYKEKVYHEKQYLVLNLLQCLGARTVSYETYVESISEREISNELKVEARVAKLSLDTQAEQLIQKKYAEKKILTIEGGKINWDEAKKLVAEHHLAQDSFINFLMNLRKPGVINACQQYEQVCSLSSEADSILNIAVNLNAIKVIKVSDKFTQVTRQKEDLKTRFTVQF